MQQSMQWDRWRNCGDIPNPTGHGTDQNLLELRALSREAE